MVITLIKGNVELILCHGAARGVDKSAGPQETVITGSEQRQIVQRFRSRTARVYPRGNAVDGYRFGVTRECASAEAAYEWAHLHRLNLPKNDDTQNPLFVEFRHGNTVTKLENADVIIAEMRPRGLIVTVQYDIAGGPWVGTTVGL